MPEQNLTNLLNLPNLEVLGYESTEDGVVLDTSRRSKWPSVQGARSRVRACMTMMNLVWSAIYHYLDERVICAYEVVGLNVRHAKTHLRKG